MPKGKRPPFDMTARQVSEAMQERVNAIVTKMHADSAESFAKKDLPEDVPNAQRVVYRILRADDLNCGRE